MRPWTLGRGMAPVRTSGCGEGAFAFCAITGEASDSRNETARAMDRIREWADRVTHCNLVLETPFGGIGEESRVGVLRLALPRKLGRASLRMTNFFKAKFS